MTLWKLSVALLLLQLPVVPATADIQFTVKVISAQNVLLNTYNEKVPPGRTLLDGLKELQSDQDLDFTFEFSRKPDSLITVNGMTGPWKVKVQNGGTGISLPDEFFDYVVSQDDEIILTKKISSERK